MAAVLSASLGLIGPGASGYGLLGAREAYAGAPSMAAHPVMRFLESKGAFKGDDDVLRTYIVGSNGSLTVLGEYLYKYFQERPDEVKEFGPAFDRLRESGAYTQKKSEAVRIAIRDFNKHFGGIDAAKTENAWAHGAKLQAILSGVANAESSQNPVVQIDREDGWDFVDKDGLVTRLDKKEQPVYHRELAKKQREMNDPKNRPVCAPLIPENGRYNYEMYLYSHCKLADQVQRIFTATHADRIMRMAELAGVQLQPDQVLADIPTKLTAGMLLQDLKGPLELRLEKKKALATFGLGGIAVRDVVDPQLAKRWGYLEKAGQSIESFKARMLKLKALPFISNEQAQGMEKAEREVVNYISLAFLEAQRFTSINQLERLNYELVTLDGKRVLRHIKGDAPDSKQLREAVANSQLTAEQKKAYLAKAQALAQRLSRILGVIDRIDENLNAPDASSRLEATQAALGQVQKELGDANVDVMIYNAMPTLAKVALDETSGFRFKWTLSQWKHLDLWEVNGVTPTATRFGAKAVNKFSKLWGGDLAGAYLANRERMDKVGYGQAFSGVLGVLAQEGEDVFQKARSAILAMDPNAIRTHWTASFDAGSADPSQAQRLEAALKKANETLGSVAKVHVYTGIAVHLAGWSLSMAVLAYPVSAGLTGAGNFLMQTGQKLITAEKVVFGGRTAGYVMRGMGMVFDNTARRLQSLSAPVGSLKAKAKAIQAIEGALVRFTNTGVRMGAFAGMSTSISGLFVMGKHAWDGDRSPFESKGDAFLQGAVGGAKWATESWHPLLVVSGLPSNVYEGTKLSGAAELVSTRGLGGMGSTLVQKEMTKLGWKAGAEKLSKVSLYGLRQVGEKGVFGAKALSTFLSTADNIAKFMIPTYGLGWAAKKISYYKNFDEASAERRIKRAEAAGLATMQLPLWLLMPVHPASAEAASSEAMAAERGLKERIARNEANTIVNAGEDTRLKLYETPEVPLMQRIFGFQLYREKASVNGEMVDAAGTFKVNKDILRRAVQHELPYAASGQQPGVKLDPTSVNPLRYYEITQKKDETSVGRIVANDVVRDEAYNLFSQSILKHPELAERVMNAASLGKMVEGFGQVGLRHQEDVALVLYRSATDPKAQTKISLSKTQLSTAEKLLEPYLKTEQVVSLKAKELGLAVAQNRASQPIQDFVLQMLDRTRAWKTEIARTKGDSAKTYMDLVAEFKKMAQDNKGSMSQADLNVVNKVLDYIEAVQARFNYFNRLGAAKTRLETGLQVMRTNHAGNKAVEAGLELMRLKMSETVDQAKGKDPLGEAGAAKDAFKNLRDLLNQRFQELRTSGFSKEDLALLSKSGSFSQSDLKVLTELKGLSKTDYSALETALKEVEAAPWLLKDAKGSSLPGWRPEQFEALMEFFNYMTTGDQLKVLRAMLMLKTGGGKTLLSIEGLAPLMEANGKDTLFLTVQTNLESQGRMEFRSLRKVTSKLEFDTWEGFKTKLAQGKLKGGGASDAWNVLGDEADAAAAQPILTVGERTASIGRQNTAFRRLEKIGERLEGLLGKEAGPQQKKLDFLVERQKQLASNLDPKSDFGQAMSKSLSEMGRVVRTLSKAQTPEQFHAAQARVDSIIARQEKLLVEGSVPVEAEVLSTFKDVGSQMRETLQTMSRRTQALQDFTIQPEPAGFKAGLRNLAAKALWTTRISGLRSSKLAAPNQEYALRQGLEKAKAQGDQALADKFEAQLSAVQEHRARVERIGNLLTIEKSTLRNATWLKSQSGQSAKDQAAIQDVSEKVLELARKAEPGWQAKARQLVSQRQKLIEGAVSSKNPIYDIYGRMRKSMYSHYNSTYRTQDDAKALREAPQRFQKGGGPEQLDLFAQEAVKDIRAMGTQAKTARQSLVQNAQDVVSGLESAVSRMPKGPQRDQAQALLSQAKAQSADMQARLASMEEGLANGSRDVNLEQVRQYRASFEKLRQLHDAYYMKEQQLKQQLETSIGKANTLALENQMRELRSRYVEEESRVLDVKNLMQKGGAAHSDALLKAMQMERFGSVDRLQQRSASAKAAEGSGQLELFPDQNIPQAEASWYDNVGKLMKFGEGYQRENLVRALESSKAETAGQTAQLMQAVTRLRGAVADPAVQRSLDAAARELSSRAVIWDSRIKSLKMTSDKAVAALDRRLDVLTKQYSKELLKAVYNDPLMPAYQRWKLIWTLLPSYLSPNRSGWVRTELINLAKGYGDDPNTIRMDHQTGSANAVHIGQWFESMDTPTRRFWELEFGADLTLPYEHRTKATMHDIIANEKTNMILFSGTANDKYRSLLKEHGITIRGVGSEGVKTQMNVVQTMSQKYSAILDSIKQMSGEKAGLVIAVVPGTHELKMMEEIARRAGLSKEQVAKVFSDAEFLRVNRGQAQVLKQMNVAGLDVGKVKFMIFDARVASRGIDLNYKGDRNNPNPEAFKGYKKIEMVVLDPHMMSRDMLTQSQGRIDLGRVNTGTERTFKLVVDLPTAAKDPVFSTMLNENPLFATLRRDPMVVQIAKAKGLAAPDWTTIHEYISRLESSGQRPELTRHYRDVVDHYLGLKQTGVGEDQLRSAGMLNDRPIFNRMNRGLEANH